MADKTNMVLAHMEPTVLDSDWNTGFSNRDES